MAANRFEYEIAAKDKTRKATRSANKNIDKTHDSFKRLGKLLKGGLALGGATIAFKKVSQAIGTVTDAYGAQQDAEIQLRAAVAKNPLLDSGSVSRLESFASSLQDVSTVGDEVAISFAGMLGSFGRSESEIRNIITAAHDLAAATDLTLESAVRNLNKTFGGLSGELGELIPELKDFTEEQLRSGEAVDFIAEKFSGLGQAAAMGVQGMKTQMENARGDLLEAVGSILAPMQSRLFGSLTEGFKDLTAWMQDNAGNIYAVFTNLGPIMRETLELIGNLIIELFTGDTLFNVIESLATFFFDQFKNTVRFIGEMFGVLFDSIADTQDQFGEDAGKAFWEAYMNAFFTLPRALLKLGARVFGIDRDFRFEFDGNDTNFGEALADNIKANAGDIRDALTNALGGAGANAQALGAALAAEFGGPVAEWQSAIDSILAEGRQEWTEYHSAIQEATDNVNDLSSAASDAARTTASAGERLTRGGDGGGIPGQAYDDFSEGYGGYGQNNWRSINRARLGEGLKNVAEGSVNALKNVGVAAGRAAQGLDLQSQALQSVKALLDAFMGGFATVMKPLVDEILPLFHGIMSVVGELWASFLLPKMSAMVEAVKLLAQGFIWLYNNALQPVGNKFLEIAKKIAESFDDIINGIISGLNEIPGVNIGNVNISDRIPGGLDKISMDELVERGEETAPTFDLPGGDTTEDGTGSISSGRKINVTVNISTEVIAGEGGLRDLAILIRDEIRAAEALGA